MKCFLSHDLFLLFLFSFSLLLILFSSFKEQSITLSLSIYYYTDIDLILFPLYTPVILWTARLERVFIPSKRDLGRRCLFASIDIPRKASKAWQLQGMYIISPQGSKLTLGNKTLRKGSFSAIPRLLVFPLTSLLTQAKDEGAKNSRTNKRIQIRE